MIILHFHLQPQFKMNYFITSQQTQKGYRSRCARVWLAISTHHKQKVVFLLGAAQFWSKFFNIFSEEPAKFTVRLQKETDHAFSKLLAHSIFLNYLFLFFFVSGLKPPWSFSSGWKMLSVNTHNIAMFVSPSSCLFQNSPLWVRCRFLRICRSCNSARIS